MKLRDVAQLAVDHGISVVPARMDGTKRPVGEWKQYQLKRASGQELDTWFHPQQEAIGVICGRVSGGLEMLEFEGRALAKGLGSRWRDSLLEAGHAELYRRVTGGYSERTPSGGVHILYRCPDGVEGNKKLARSDDGVLIETRGEGGFVVIAPTTGNCHPSGNPWKLVKGSIETISTITPEERQIIHDHARLLDETPVRNAPDGASAPQADGDDERPGDRYNADPDALKATYDLLLRHGWQHHHQGRDGEYYLTRPGKNTRDGWSATLGHPKTGGQGFYVFTTSDQFEADHSYSPFQVLTILEHNGDYSAAARALVAEEDAPEWEVVIGSSDEPTTDPSLFGRFLDFARGDLAHLPQPETILGPWFQQAGVNIVFGRGASYKSFVVQSAACSMATLQPWGHLGVREKQTVVYWAAEGRSGLHARFNAWSQHHDQPIDTGFLIVPERWPRLDDPALGERMAEELERVHCTFLVIDTLNRTKGRLKENDSDDLGTTLFDTLTPIVASGIGVCIVHHSGWQASHTRGASALFDNADQVYKVVKDGPHIQMFDEKGKDNAERPALWFDMTPTAGSLVLEPQEQVPLTDHQKEIMKALRDGTWVSTTDIGDSTGFDRKRIGEWIEPLVGRLVERQVQGKGKPALYRTLAYGSQEVAEW